MCLTWHHHTGPCLILPHNRVKLGRISWNSQFHFLRRPSPSLTSWPAREIHYEGFPTGIVWLSWQIKLTVLLLQQYPAKKNPKTMYSISSLSSLSVLHVSVRGCLAETEKDHFTGYLFIMEINSRMWTAFLGGWDGDQEKENSSISQPFGR